MHGSPLHDDQEALGIVVNVFIKVNDGHDVPTGGGATVQVNLSTRLGAVTQHLKKLADIEKADKKIVKMNITTTTGAIIQIKNDIFTVL